MERAPEAGREGEGGRENATEIGVEKDFHFRGKREMPEVQYCSTVPGYLLRKRKMREREREIVQSVSPLLLFSLFL